VTRVKRTYKQRQPLPGRLRGRLSIYHHGKHGWIARAWQRPGRPNPSDAEIATRDLFIAAVKNVKQLPGNLLEQLQADSAGTAWTWKDLAISLQYGRNVTITAPDGTTYRGWRDMADDMQQLLDSIIDAPGAILVRTSAKWMGLLPGPAGEVLTSKGPGVAPDYYPVPTGGGGGAQFTPYCFDPGASNAFSAGYMGLLPCVLPAGAAIKGIAIYARTASPSASVSPGIYDDAPGSAANLVATGPAVTGIVPGINLLPFTTDYTPPGEALYYAGVIVQGATYDAAAVRSYGKYAAVAGTAWPATAPTMSTLGPPAWVSWPYY